ncbi:GntR family transcriptional regulator [Clostridium sp. 19966]|uniref:TrkA C-terminal domain-containing protein n=1 Tax=Clostridium sp. 19966 TaxID=2768166 RepID=UPI0028DFB6A7|nr:TrkA C-terminal domain-containing protein [Clostridium sp. 19966]MDT8718508.1 GntR family transcriptional regulator [Clostridium sp. 19966]
MKKEGEPIYKKIALDIANKIVRGEIKVNDKISGRSMLASMYKVSPETVRRAIALLKEMGVVTANVGSGIEVLSISAAEKFIQKNKSNEYVSTMVENIYSIIQKRRELDKELEQNFTNVLEFVGRFKNITPFVLVEVIVKSDSRFIGKSINEVKFWQNTRATIIAYRRKEEIVISPGPNYKFLGEDAIVVIGKEDVYDKVNSFLNG